MPLNETCPRCGSKGVVGGFECGSSWYYGVLTVLKQSDRCEVNVLKAEIERLKRKLKAKAGRNYLEAMGVTE